MTYIILWYLVGCLGSFLTWRLNARISYPQETCPSPFGIVTGLFCAISGPLIIFFWIIGCVTIWIMTPKRGWFWNPVCNKER